MTKITREALAIGVLVGDDELVNALHTLAYSMKPDEKEVEVPDSFALPYLASCREGAVRKNIGDKGALVFMADGTIDATLVGKRVIEITKETITN